MIKLIVFVLLLKFSYSFRLLNSEIGNDPKGRLIMKIVIVGFRLLNSEIGNDHHLHDTIYDF